VLPRPADQDVVPGAAVQDVVPRAADQDVVAFAAVGDQGDRPRRQPGGLHHVVTGQALDAQNVIGRLGAGDVDPSGQAKDRRARRVADRLDHVVAVGAVDDDGVSGAIACGAPEGAGEVQVELPQVGTGKVVDRDDVGPAQGVEV